MEMKEMAITFNRVISLRLEKVSWLVIFLVPLIFSGPQLVVGSIVNATLFVAAGRLSGKNVLPVIILPSIAALTRGILFGPFTPFLAYFMPFIWLGNYLLIATFIKLKPISPFLLRIIISAATKAVFLFLIANIYFELHFVPQLFLKTMGITQFITAMMGGFLALFIIRATSKPGLRKDLPVGRQV